MKITCATKIKTNINTKENINKRKAIVQPSLGFPRRTHMINLTVAAALNTSKTKIDCSPHIIQTILDHVLYAAAPSQWVAGGPGHPERGGQSCGEYWDHNAQGTSVDA